jgi:hypothetical protein
MNGKIMKFGKDAKGVENYRLISLTSCICNVMEKMVGKRVSWFLEKNAVINNEQFGSRKNRSTNDGQVILK